MQEIWHFGTPLGATFSVIHFRKLFSGTTSPSQIACLYLEPFKSNRAWKLAILKKSLQKFNVFRIIVDTPGGYHLMPYIFRHIFPRATFTSQIACLYLVPFRSYLASKLTILENSTYFAFWGATWGLSPQTLNFRKFFSRATFASILCLYLKPLNN